MIKIPTAFTLVELIVVVTILAILATIGFVSYSGYLSGVRDTNRIASVTSISDGLELYRTRNDLPNPDNAIVIKANGIVIGNQGNIGSNVIQTIEYSKSGKDPKDDDYYSYYLSDNKKYYQLMAFLEESENLDSKIIVGSANALIDYKNRYAKSYGKKLGIITDINNQPIQNISLIGSELDIVLTNDYYNMYFNDTEVLTGTGLVLQGGMVGGGLVGYWNFDEIKDNSFIDYSQNNASGSITGGVSISSDAQSNNSALFDGIDGEFIVDLIKNVGANGGAPHSISAWIKPDSIPGDCGGTNTCRQWMLFFGSYDGTPGSFSGKHHWLIGGYHSPYKIGLSNRKHSLPIEAGKWNHVLVTTNGSKSIGYLNGKAFTKSNSRATVKSDLDLRVASLLLGKPIISNESFYKGNIDELRIYNKFLSQEEVLQIYNIEK